MRKSEVGESAFWDLLHRAEEARTEAEVYMALAEILAGCPDPEFVVRAVCDPAVVRIVSLIHELYEVGEFELAREVEQFFALLASAGRGRGDQ